MATHSSILAWKIPWTEKPSGLQSMASQRVGHDLATENAHNLLINWSAFKIKSNLLFVSISHSFLSKCTQWVRKLLVLCLLLISHIYTAWKGNISFPINVSADLAPVAVMLVYTLHPSGDIIADSVKFQVEKCFKNKVRSLLFLACSEWEGWAVYSLVSPCFLTAYNLYTVISQSALAQLSY